MAKSDYLSSSDDGFGHQLITFKNSIGAYAVALSARASHRPGRRRRLLQLHPAMPGDHPKRRATVDHLENDRAHRRQPAAHRRARSPRISGRRPAVAPGIEPRFRALAKQIKSNSDYNESIGAALGIEGSQQVGPDYSTLAPVLDLSINGGRVFVNWGWQGYAAFLDQCELQVDRADGKGMVLLAIDTTPGYVDTQSFPSVATKWTYQAIYRVADNRVGQWSNPVSIAVGV